MAQNRKSFRNTNRGNYKKTFIAYPFEKNEEIQLRIDGFSSQGHGVGRIDHTPKSGEPVKNWVIFIPFSLPGELVKVKVTHNTKKNSTAEIIEVLSASEFRAEPPCRHFFYCGGCQLQHIEYSHQLQLKQEHLTSLIERVTELSTSIKDPIPSPKTLNYRSKLTPQFSKPVKGKVHSIGFHHHTNKDNIIDVQECAIAMESINLSLAKQREMIKGRGRTLTEQGSFLLRSNDDRVETEELNVVSEKVGGLTFHFLAKDFFQNNPFILEDFTQYVAKQASSNGAKYLIDTYCGSGLFALCLSSHFEKVVGIEVSITSADWARYNAEFNNIENATFITGSAEKIFENVDFDSDLSSVIIDPPRAGCSSSFLDQLIGMSPKTIVYVSCDPSTQVRDMEHFIKAGYHIDEIQPFDLFPQTRHLECVITLVR